MNGCIYLIRNLIDGKAYIGQTVDLRKRWILHKSRARTGRNHPLYHAIRKYGIENFVLVEIVRCEPFFLDEWEKLCIDRFDTLVTNGKGYNLARGGDSNFEMSDETKTKMSQAKLGKKRPPFTIEHRQRMSESAKLRNRPPSRKGSSHSQATRNKISVAMRKRSQHNTQRENTL